MRWTMTIACLVLLACSAKSPTGNGPATLTDGSKPLTDGPTPLGDVPIPLTDGPTPLGDASNSPEGGTAAPVSEEMAAKLTVLSGFDQLTPDGLLARASTAPNQPLGYDPATATWLDLIQSSILALSDSELGAYKQNGFVIAPRHAFPNFFHGYKAIYAADLPLYVSADSVLYAFHRSYDAILAQVEQDYLASALGQILAATRKRIATTAIGDNAKKDLEVLLGVAAVLLNPTSTNSNAEVTALAGKATSASGTETVSLFGSSRDLDFSQFKPRGHYDTGGTLAQYFRAMMWLGRTEFRLVDVENHGKRTLLRREVEDTLALRELFTPELLVQWENLDKILVLFVGEADYLDLPQVDRLKTALGLADSTALSTISDATLLKTIDEGNFGLQRIASQLMETDPGMTTLPNSFALFGQRYVIDSHVFTKVVYPATVVKRMMPNPLDMAYAALGNDQATVLLREELNGLNYAPGLAQARQLVDWHDDGYWNSSLYTYWLSALRELSPGRPNMADLPAIARTEAWGRRILNTQLASWAELRHDTLLYAKQSYTGTPVCEYPDGYVDPYPGVFRRLKEMSTLAADRLTTVLPSGTSAAAVAYFKAFADVNARLENMAKQELAGAPRTPEDIAFLNDAVVTKTVSVVCTTVTRPSGWYPNLFFNQDDALKQDPTIADVHTQPADEAGNPVGKVLHVATGNPRLMVLSVDSCVGHRAYAGVVSAYHEKITDNFKRMTNQEWLPQVPSAVDVPWMAKVITR